MKPDAGINRSLKAHQEAIERVEAANIEKAINGRLADAYRAAYKSIEAELAKLYASSSGDLAEARKYGRLESLKASIASEYAKLTKKAIAETGRAAANAYANGAMGSRWAFDEALGVDIKWPLLQPNAIREAVREEVAGEDYAERLKYYELDQRVTIQRHVVQGLATGAGYKKTARKLRDDIEVSLGDAARIVRTESARDFTLGKLQTHEDVKAFGVETRLQWVSATDDRVRDDHRDLDEKLADENGEWHINGKTTRGPGLWGSPEDDINERCTIIDVIEGYEPEKLERYADGFSSASYTEWAISQGWTADKGWPKATEANR